MLHIGAVTLEQYRAPAAWPSLVLCARDTDLAQAWEVVRADDVSVYHGSVLDVDADAVVSPANSYGSMRGGIDELYAATFSGIEERVRNAILRTHGGELPVGQAEIVATGAARPAWLISAPTMRTPTERLPADTVHPYLAARAVFLLWRDGMVYDHHDHPAPVRDLVRTIAIPGLGTGIGGVDVANCARQVDAAWHEVFGCG